MDKDLIKRIKKDDESAFCSIYAKYKPLLKHFSLRFISVPELADDIVQEVFVTIWTNRKKLDPNKSFKAYLITCTRNKIYDTFKEASRNTELRENLWKEFEVQRNFTEEKINAIELNTLIENAISLLSERKRVIFELSRFKGKTHEEIAQELGISKNTVKNHIVESVQFIHNYISSKSDVALSALGVFLYFN